METSVQLNTGLLCLLLLWELRFLWWTFATLHVSVDLQLSLALTSEP